MAAEWNDFVAASRNATFLFDRRYMDYHADRFSDCSMIACKGGRKVAMLPANITDDGVLHSHGGLTYGGWILSRKHADAPTMLELWLNWLDKCRAMGIKAIDYKPMPHIYAMQPSDEDIYALWRSGAELCECNISTAIRLAANPGLNDRRRRFLRKASALDFKIFKAEDNRLYDEFYEVLATCLAERHGTVPVHSLEELRLLHQRFPDNIRLWVLTHEGRTEAGVLLYISARAAHAQYIATTSFARDNNLLTPLFTRLIDEAQAGTFGPDVEYFDFGTSNEEHGWYLNETLYRQKVSFGATAVAYTRYLLKL